MVSKNKNYFWLGMIFTCLGIALFGLVFSLDFRDAPQKQYFDACMGLIFLYVGIKRIKKSRQPDDYSLDSFEVQKNIINQSASFEFKERTVEISEKVKTEETGTPLFIKCVALSPLIPLSITILAEIGCRLLGFRDSTCIGHHLQEGMAYLGALGWFVTLPIAGLLKLIYSSSKL